MSPISICRLGLSVAFFLAIFSPRLVTAQNITLQQPVFGIAIDSDGVLATKTFSDPTGKLLAKRVASAKAAMSGDILRRSDLRKVSLVKLERAISAKLDVGQKPDEAMLRLAGLQRAQYVFFYPDERDIVIAGPAEGWVDDLSERTVGLTTGRPTLLLDDLVVALRAYPPGSRQKPFLGCTIEPRPEGVARLAEFHKTIPRTIPESQRDATAARIAKGVRDALGMSNIRVFTVSEKTHFAQVLIEADLRMKLIGIGLEPPPVKMTTFIAALDSPRMSSFQRWWFTPDYDCVKVTDDRLAMELVGPGVQLQAQDMVAAPGGRLVAVPGPTNKASELYTLAFTRKYAEIAARAPVYAQLRNMFDLAVVAAFLREQDYYGKAGWKQGVLADESKLPVETLSSPKQVQCAVNSLWKESRLLVPAGGVAIEPDLALSADRLKPDTDGKLKSRRGEIAQKLPVDRWWWD